MENLEGKIMEEWVNASVEFLNSYVASFQGLNAEQENNFNIKKEHSIRVAKIAQNLAEGLSCSEEECNLAFLIGIFHDIGRFKQLLEFNTFDDSKSVNHADYSVAILEERKILEKLNCSFVNEVNTAILNHNKFELPKKLSDTELLFSKLLRDADKIDILNVLSKYYSAKNEKPNHTLTWELPKSNKVSQGVINEVFAEKLVSKKVVKSDIDVKIMQLSWVYDINFRASYEFIIKNRYLEIIYNSLPKNDVVIGIYRKIKVFAENKLLN